MPRCHTDGRDDVRFVFNGADTFVDCGAVNDMDLSAGGTVEVWCRPKSKQGGLVSWHTGTGWGLISALCSHSSRTAVMRRPGICTIWE